MYRWQSLLNQLRTDDPVLQEKLSCWKNAPNDTPLALIRDLKIIGTNRAALDYFDSDYDTYVNSTPYDFAPRIQSSGRNSVESAKEMLLKAISHTKIEFNWLHLSAKGKELPTHIRLYRCEFESQLVVLAEYTPLNRRQQVAPKSPMALTIFPWKLWRPP